VRRELARVLVAAFLLEVAWGLSSTYLALEIYGELGLPGYFIAMSIGCTSGFISAITSGILVNLLRSRRLPLILIISFTSLSLLCCAMSGANLLLASFLLGLLLSYEPVAISSLGEGIDHGEASGIYYAVSRSGISFGLLIGGFLLDHINIEGLLTISSLLFLSSLPIFPDQDDRMMSMTFKGRTHLRALGALAPILLAEDLVMPLMYSLLEIKLYEALGRSSLTLGSIYAISNLLEIATGPLIGKMVDKLGGLRSFLCSSFVQLAGLLACITLSEGEALILLMLLPIASLYFSSRNKLAVEISGENSTFMLSFITSISSLSDALFYGLLFLLSGTS